MITATNVSLAYGKRVIFQDVNIKFTPGNWDQVQYVKFRAATDTAAEGTRTTFINHTAQNSSRRLAVERLWSRAYASIGVPRTYSITA